MQEGFSGLSTVFDPLTTEEGLLLSGSTLFLGVWLVKGDEGPESELDGRAPLCWYDSRFVCGTHVPKY